MNHSCQPKHASVALTSSTSPSPSHPALGPPRRVLPSCKQPCPWSAARQARRHPSWQRCRHLAAQLPQGPARGWRKKGRAWILQGLNQKSKYGARADPTSFMFFGFWGPALLAAPHQSCCQVCPVLGECRYAPRQAAVLCCFCQRGRSCPGDQPPLPTSPKGG